MSSTENTPLLTEEKIRSFVMCPRFVSFGGTNVFPDSTNLLRLSTEKAISDCLRKNRLDPDMRYMKALIKSTQELGLKDKYSEGQLLVMQTAVARSLGELFSAFGANKYLPVFGPTPWKVRISKSAVQMQISGILRSVDNQTLHIIDFTPYQEMHGIRNDPIIYLKAKTIMQFVKPWFNRSQCVIHTFGLGETYNLIYHSLDSENIKDTELNRIKVLVQGLEIGLDFPTLPCKVKCPFKSKCFLGTE